MSGVSWQGRRALYSLVLPAAVGLEPGIPPGLALYHSPVQWLRATEPSPAALRLCVQASEMSSGFLLQFELNCCSEPFSEPMDVSGSADT